MKNSAGNRLGSFARFSLMALVGLALAGGAAAVRGQSALDGFDPNANGDVYVVVVQPDGKILIGGNFTTLSPNGGVAVTRNRLARPNPAGTAAGLARFGAVGAVANAFGPDAVDVVDSVGVRAVGEIFVGGNFFSVGGQTRHFIARLDATTGLADSFNPNANNFVYSIAVQA